MTSATVEFFVDATAPDVAGLFVNEINYISARVHWATDEPTSGTFGAVSAQLGAPGPESTTSPAQRNATIKATLIDPGCPGTGNATTACARVRDTTQDDANNSHFGTLTIRRKFINNSGGMVTLLRFRIVDITTAPATSGAADLRVRTSTTLLGATLAGGGTTDIVGLTLGQPPAQPSGGGLNSTVAAGTITLNAPLAQSATLNVQFLLGVQQSGNYRFFVNVEAVTGTAAAGTTKSNRKLPTRR